MEQFEFETLEIWKKGVEFADHVIGVVEHNRHSFRLKEQLFSAVSSIPQNIAEGRGRYSRKENIHFLHIARGSLFETVTLIEIYYRRKWLDQNSYFELKTKAIRLGKMLNSFIRYQKTLPPNNPTTQQPNPCST